jgi:hypothetical protein
MSLALKPVPVSGIIQRMQTQSNGSNRSAHQAPVLISPAPTLIPWPSNGQQVCQVGIAMQGSSMQEQMNLQCKKARVRWYCNAQEAQIR